ncbi:hypothetical protein PtrSN002B_011226 [Pyrenophora tritici-repentis]|uniref:Uncharacterized protein n=1 Tax=Pyrenophora tritici-repentis TaxID=45151 RepID=A0A2W1CY51_9PLEO|nr:hypothetical protein PtrV1_01490 [Pyrenophora tritici-repentis]KAF7454227.1 hypothetical protein A1F99_014850 [Pyrenophora tritici-repentis]KAF7577324.1 hypothetical protein PtrM4_015640 [Pyrenophora tritici-repentis]KAG9387978.1 hypothetical protein A1F94_000870 [Pyrenophora tritici-repentis]KAI0570101.1 hypothetical protein Alg215_11260 [Pyrenophora tritici-repentis]
MSFRGARAHQNSHTRGYRTSPHGGGSQGKFDPGMEKIDDASPGAERVQADPFHHYVIRTGYHKGKTLAQFHKGNDNEK